MMDKLDEGQIATAVAGVKSQYDKYRKVRNANPQLSRLTALSQSLKGKEEKDPLKAAAATSQALGDVVATSFGGAAPTKLEKSHSNLHKSLVDLIKRGGTQTSKGVNLKPQSERRLAAISKVYGKLKTVPDYNSLPSDRKKTADQYVTAIQSRLQKYASDRFSQDLSSPRASQRKKPIEPMSTSTIGNAAKAAGRTAAQGAVAAANWVRSRLPEDAQLYEELSTSQKLRLSGASPRVRRALALAQMGKPVPLSLQQDYLRYLHTTGDVDTMASGTAMRVIRQHARTDIDYEKHILLAKNDPSTTAKEKSATVAAFRILKRQNGNIAKLPSKSRTLITSHMQRTGAIASLPVSRVRQVLKSQQQ